MSIYKRAFDVAVNGLGGWASLEIGDVSMKNAEANQQIIESAANYSLGAVFLGAGICLASKAVWKIYEPNQSISKLRNS